MRRDGTIQDRKGSESIAQCLHSVKVQLTLTDGWLA